MDRDEAMKLAKIWFGEHADVNDEDLGETPNERFAVGYWKPNPESADEFERQWGEFRCVGVGTSWATAFRQADPKRWKAYCLTTKRRSMFRPEVTE